MKGLIDKYKREFGLHSGKGNGETSLWAMFGVVLFENRAYPVCLVGKNREAPFFFNINLYFCLQLIIMAGRKRSARATRIAMKVINLRKENSVVNNYLAQLRDVNYQKNRTLFRGNLERIGHVMAYELSRTLDYTVKDVQTPLGIKQVPTYDDHIVVGTVLRAGLAFHQGFLDVFDQADAGFVAAYREEGKRDDIRIHLEYMAAPNLQDSTFLLVDPMLATGGSLELAYKTFLRLGTPKKLHICCVIASEEGVAHLKKVFPSDDVTLWVGVIDPALNEDAYIVPGLGDAGDLSFGEKISLKR